uniref:Uncharacterized protein n=1 Tax=viral metagenome TaxID=1070528 RepID=A0A6M3M624_9ZZZZ
MTFTVKQRLKIFAELSGLDPSSPITGCRAWGSDSEIIEHVGLEPFEPITNYSECTTVEAKREVMVTVLVLLVVLWYTYELWT